MPDLDGGLAAFHICMARLALLLFGIGGSSCSPASGRYGHSCRSCSRTVTYRADGLPLICCMVSIRAVLVDLGDLIVMYGVLLAVRGG